MDKTSKKTTMTSKKGGAEGDQPPPGAEASRSVLPATSAPSRLGKARAACWTMFNYDPYLERLRQYKDQCRYMVFGFEECPDTGRKHLQGYVAWDTSHHIGAFSKQFGNCHIEAARGSAQKNREYCSKGGKFEEYGDMPKQGHRKDWDQVVSDCKEGKPIDEIIDANPHLAFNVRHIRELKNMYLKPKHREVNVVCIVGDAGSGKTRYAYENHTDIYSKPRGEWWDGYTGQTTILLDDYYGYIPYCELLRVLDRYPYQVPIKGGYVQAQWDTVIITSNKMPQQWYKDGLTPALRRRLKKVIYYRSIDGETTQEEIPLEEARISEA